MPMIKKSCIRGILNIAVFLLSSSSLSAADRIYHKGWSLAASGGASYLLHTSDELKQMMDSHVYPVFDFRAGYTTSPVNGGLYGSEYNYPTAGFGFTYSNLNGIAYKGSSHLNDVFDLYAFFNRDIIRRQRYAFGYELLFGLGISDNKYDPVDNALNECINSSVIFDIGAGPYVRFRVSPHVELDASLKFRHHSFGKLTYPNSGINECVGLITARYYLEDAVDIRDTASRRDNFRKGLSYEFSAGGGVERCDKEWDVYNLMEPDPGRKVTTINAYPKYFFSFQTAYRYAPKFSTGVGIDMFYSSRDCIRSLERCERVLYGDDEADNARYNQFSCGLSIVQNFHFGNFAVWGLVGAYLYNHSGVSNSSRVFYQKIGIKHTFAKAGGLTLSMCCKAHHFSKAEMMEFGVAFKI